VGSVPAYGWAVKQAVLIVFDLQQLRARQADPPRKNGHIQASGQSQGLDVFA
jgi:hypothetical protein